MTGLSLDQVIACVGTGLSLLLAGGVGLVLRNRGGWVRLTVAGVATAGGGVLAGALGTPGQATAAVGLSALSLGLWAFTISSAAGSLGVWAGRLVRRPLLQAGLPAIMGLGLIGGSVAGFVSVEEAEMDRDMDWMEGAAVVNSTPELQPATALLTTDLGHRVPVMRPVQERDARLMRDAEARVLSDQGFANRVIRTGGPTEVTNCHGWVFTGGRYWLPCPEVETILRENGYRPVSDPQPTDLVVYRQAGLVVHTGVVRYTGDGEPMVEGKWGWMGVFLHPAGGSCYGKDFTFYRSPRHGHLLAGLPHPGAGGSRDVEPVPAVRR